MAEELKGLNGLLIEIGDEVKRAYLRRSAQ